MVEARILNNPQQFASSLNEILNDIKDKKEGKGGEGEGESSLVVKFDLKEWFNQRLMPLIKEDVHNCFMAQLYIKKAIAERGKGEKTSVAIYQLQGVLELLKNTFSNAENNEDSRLASENVRFADCPNATPELINAISNIFTTQDPTGGDILKIARHYRLPNPPHISLLRAPDVIEPIIWLTFSPNHYNQQMSEKLFLIAYAAFWNNSHTVKEDIKLGNSQLTELSKLLEKCPSMIQLSTHLPLLLSMLKEPIFCSAILIWLSKNLFNDDFYEWTALSMSTPCAFHILDEIAIIHPFHRRRILDIWISLFEREFEFNDMDSRVVQQVTIQFREKFMEHFVLLFDNQFERPVLEYLASKADSIDPSLAILFLSNTLVNLIMPVPKVLYGLMLQMIEHAPGKLINAAPQLKRLIENGHSMKLSDSLNSLLKEIEEKMNEIV